MFIFETFIKIFFSSVFETTISIQVGKIKIKWKGVVEERWQSMDDQVSEKQKKAACPK